MRRRGLLAAVGAAAGAVIIGPAVTAGAATPVVLGGGAGIIVNGATLCTLTAIGHDNRGSLIGFTSAHCGGPGAEVAAESDAAAGNLGVMVAGNENLDYAVIEFDPAKVTPVSNYHGFLISGIGPDPTFGQVACKLGRSTGDSCGVTWGPGQDPGTILNQVCGGPGDSGAPVTVGNQLVGMIHGAFNEGLPQCVTQYIPLHTPAVTISMTAVLADLNEKGRPGAGFVPVA